MCTVSPWSQVNASVSKQTIGLHTQQENMVISTADAYYRWDAEIGWIKVKNTTQAVLKLKEKKPPKSVYSKSVYTCVGDKTDTQAMLFPLGLKGNGIKAV